MYAGQEIKNKKLVLAVIGGFCAFVFLVLGWKIFVLLREDFQPETPVGKVPLSNGNGKVSQENNQIAQEQELDQLRNIASSEDDLASDKSQAASLEQQEEELEKLRTQQPVVNLEEKSSDSTGVLPKKTEEEQMNELDSLRNLITE